MKKIVEVSNQGMETLLGEKVTFFGLNYIYYGKLIGVNEHDIILENAYIVYETGAFSDSKFKDAQKIANEFRLRTAIVESYGVLNKTV